MEIAIPSVYWHFSLSFGCTLLAQWADRDPIRTAVTDEIATEVVDDFH